MKASSTLPPLNKVILNRIHHTVTKLITGSPPLSMNAQSHHFSWLVAACSIWEASIHISTPPTHKTSLTLSLGYSILIMHSCLTVSIRACVGMRACGCVLSKPLCSRMSCLVLWMFGWQCVLISKSRCHCDSSCGHSVSDWHTSTWIHAGTIQTESTVEL